MGGKCDDGKCKKGSLYNEELEKCLSNSYITTFFIITFLGIENFPI